MAASLVPDLNVARAKLPATYEAAKTSLDKCSRIDECADWADKAEALASYAKQADDDTLRKMADRIQARAIRRMGELFRAIKRPEQGGRPSKNGGGAPPVSRSQAARDAGIGRDRKRDSIRVSRIEQDAFEAAIESDDPPTVTELARRGTQSPPLVDLKGRDPEEFAKATQAQGQLRRFAEFAETVPPAVIVRGAFPREHAAMKRHATTARDWLTALIRAIEKGHA